MKTTPIGLVMLNDEREHVWSNNNPQNQAVVNKWGEIIRNGMKKRMAARPMSSLRRRSSPVRVAQNYLIAGKTLTWTIIGLALFSTSISTVHLVSLAQEGYVNGLAYGNFEWMAAFTLIALSLFFAPLYIRANVATCRTFHHSTENWRLGRGGARMFVLRHVFQFPIDVVGPVERSYEMGRVDW